MSDYSLRVISTQLEDIRGRMETIEAMLKLVLAKQDESKVIVSGEGTTWTGESPHLPPQ